MIKSWKTINKLAAVRCSCMYSSLGDPIPIRVADLGNLLVHATSIFTPAAFVSMATGRCTEFALAFSFSSPELLVHLAHLKFGGLSLYLGLLLPFLLAHLTRRLVPGAVAGCRGDGARVLERLLLAVPERLEICGAPILL